MLRTLDLEDLERALGMFHEAVGLDPEFGAAHAALARCYVLHAQGSGGDEHYQLAERSLRRALELDPTDLEARLQGVHVDLHHGNKEQAKATITALRREAAERSDRPPHRGHVVPAGRALRSARPPNTTTCSPSTPATPCSSATTRPAWP